MTKRVQWIGHITAQANEFAGRAREITVDITTNELRIHDGSTPGGHRILNLAQLETLFQPFGNSDFESIQTDEILEHTGNAGVTIDGVLVKDGAVDGIDVSNLATVVTGIDTDLGVAEAALAAHIANVSNPHAVTKTQVGLANVSNDAQLKIASNLSDLANASTARTNLGLGALATLSAVGSAQITDGAIVNADINASAAIALSKLATQAANSLVGNFTAGVAVPTAAVAGYGLSLVTNPGVSLQMALWQDQKAAGTDGGTPTADAWTKRTCDDEVFNTITGLSEASSVFTFATNGTYLLFATAPFLNVGSVGGAIIRLRNTSDGTTIAVGDIAYTAATGTNDKSIAIGRLVIAGSAKNVEIQYYIDVGNPDGLGKGNIAASGKVAVFAQLFVIRIA